MIITTKYSMGDTIWFVCNCEMYCQQIIGVECMATEEGTKAVYYAAIPAANDREKKINVVVSELHAFGSKDELLNSLTDRFYKSMEQGSA